MLEEARLPPAILLAQMLLLFTNVFNYLADIELGLVGGYLPIQTPSLLWQIFQRLRMPKCFGHLRHAAYEILL